MPTMRKITSDVVGSCLDFVGGGDGGSVEGALPSAGGGGAEALVDGRRKDRALDMSMETRLCGLNDGSAQGSERRAINATDMQTAWATTKPQMSDPLAEGGLAKTTRSASSPGSAVFRQPDEVANAARRSCSVSFSARISASDRSCLAGAGASREGSEGGGGEDEAEAEEATRRRAEEEDGRGRTRARERINEGRRRDCRQEEPRRDMSGGRAEVVVGGQSVRHPKA